MARTWALISTRLKPPRMELSNHIGLLRLLVPCQRGLKDGCDYWCSRLRSGRHGGLKSAARLD
jgi:hypothetical protein